MKIVATIEARMTSSRLPGKVLMPVLGKTMLHYLVMRLRASPSIDEIVLATTINKADDPLVEFADNENLKVFRGDEDDVMERVIGAADYADADVVVEITGDCPIIDPEIIEQTIRMFKTNNVDYVSNGFTRSYPDGMDVQVFKLSSLKKSASMTNDALEHEHVSLHMCRHPEIFPQINLTAPPSLHWPELGLTLDEKDDYDLLKLIIEHFDKSNPMFSCSDVIALLNNNSDWLRINENVNRKGNT